MDVTSRSDARHTAGVTRTANLAFPRFALGVDRGQNGGAGSQRAPATARERYFTRNSLIEPAVVAGRKPAGMVDVFTVAVAVPFSNFPVADVRARLHEDVP
jgi:hypothetical protein